MCNYCSGPNHILPTCKISNKNVKDLQEIFSKLAEIEGLIAYKKSTEIRQ